MVRRERERARSYAALKRRRLSQSEARRERRQRWSSVLGEEESRAGVVGLDVGEYCARDGDVDSWRRKRGRCGL
jgi:hypothetical protein